MLRKTIPNFITMEKEFRSMITFGFWGKLNVRRLEKILRKCIRTNRLQLQPSGSLVYEFQRSRTSLFDRHRPGRPIEVSVDDVVIDDRQDERNL